MTSETANSPRYRPYASGQPGPAMGLRPLAEADWLEPGGDFATQMAEKERLLATKRNRVAVLSGDYGEAGEEVLARVIGFFREFHPGHYRFGPDVASCQVTGREVPLGNDDPLITASKLAQEDFCLMRRSDEGGYLLAAGVVCFPSRWSLLEKAGKPIAAIHDPVPHYGEVLERPVNRFFAMLKPAKPVWRLNWSLHDNDVLFQPGGDHRLEERTEVRLPEDYVIRVERQTLRRLDCGDVLFTIRTHCDPLTAITGDSEARTGMAAALEAYSPAQLAYKNLTGKVPALTGWLRG